MLQSLDLHKMEFRTFPAFSSILQPLMQGLMVKNGAYTMKGKRHDSFFAVPQLLTDKAMIQEKRKLAIDSLEQLQAYTKVDSNSQDWQVSLKGSCL